MQAQPDSSNDGEKRLTRRADTPRPDGGAYVRDGRRHDHRAPAKAPGRGWLSLALGGCELLAPAGVARLVGVEDTERSRHVLRALGTRELAMGAGLLAGRGPARWPWAPVVGDLIHLTLLETAHGKRRGRRTLAVAALAGMTALDLWSALRSRRVERGAGVAPRSADAEGDDTVVARAAITIDRPASEVYELWRDFANLPRFLTQVRSVEVLDRVRSRWRASLSGLDQLTWEAVVTEDRPNELIAWRASDEADVRHAGQVRFVAAPGDRGTEVHLKMNVLPPGGPLGRAVGKLAHRLPEQLLTADLRRLKQLLEIGEITQSDASIHRGPHAARPEELS